jgi:hypothetical protein
MSRTFETVNDRLPRMRRLIDDADVVCPGGCAARGGMGVMCRPVQRVIDARRDPTLVANRCLSDNAAAGTNPAQPGYQGCDVWRAARDADHETKRFLAA